MSQPPDVPPDPFEGIQNPPDEPEPPVDLKPPQESPSPGSPNVLNYASRIRPSHPPPHAGYAGHAVAGALSYFVILIGGFGVLSQTRGSMPVALVSIVMANVFVCAVAENAGWKGFTTGTLIAFPLSCLIGLALCASHF